MHGTGVQIMLLNCFEGGNLSNVPEFLLTSTHTCTKFSHYES